jgi:hypothetical protein
MGLNLLIIVNTQFNKEKKLKFDMISHIVTEKKRI